MKKTMVLVLILLFSVSILSGCSSDNKSQRRIPNRFVNMSDAERQKMFEERQKMMIEECNGKSENDSCIIVNRFGNISGKCNITRQNLSCTPKKSYQRTE